MGGTGNMNVSTGKKPHKRGQRKNTLDIPQRFLDSLTPTVLETPRSTQQKVEEAPNETLTHKSGLIPFKTIIPHNL